MVVFSLFFGKLAKMPSHGLPYPVFYYSALLPWTYFATSLQNATNVMVEQQRADHQSLFSAPGSAHSAVLSGLVDFGDRFRSDRLMAYYRIRSRTYACFCCRSSCCSPC